MRYINYHKHTHYSNLKTLDCIVKPEDYIKRARELGHREYVTTEHGWGGNYLEAYSLCKESREDYINRVESNLKENNLSNLLQKNCSEGEKFKYYLSLKNQYKFCNKYDLKMIFGVEAYYVDNISESLLKKDRTNYHLMLIALNRDGFKDINRIISESNISGFYYKNRIDKDLLLSLNPSNVIVTTACIAGRLFKTDDYEEKFLLPVFHHFDKNFYLEVQSHISQASYNNKVLQLHYKYNIPIIHANDSHYIYEEDSKYRDLFLKAKGMIYEEEDNFILDYPDSNTIYDRYNKQGILSKNEVTEALNNTLIFDKCKDLNFTDEIKIPKLYSNKDSNEVLKNILYKEWDIKKKGIPENKHKESLEAINSEFEVIKDTGMADYFIDDYEIVKKAVNDYNAFLTPTGRGSAVSFVDNYILGFTQVNRIINNSIPLFPSRFMSKARILQTRSLPDIDLNMSEQEPFIKASKDVLGDDNVYFMISYKPLQEAAAFRLWCKANDMDINEYNDVAKNLDDYIDDKKWKNIIEDSKIFRGVIESVSPSPCSFLLYDKPISTEVGLIRVGDQKKKKSVICCCMDKYSADKYKYLKNDYLVVQVLNIIKGTCNLADIPIPTLDELESKLDEKTWDIYAKGLTATVNQADSDFARPLAMKYKMHSVAEVARWVAAIRPGFGNLNSFLNREKYSTGVPQIDELLESSQHFILFQENIMQFLIYCGIEEDLTYGIIKNISKKHMTQEDFENLKETLKEGYKNKIGSYNGFDKIWEAMQSASKYSFNSSHALSYAYDSIYCAYLKSHYPLEYFSTVLNMYSGNTDETEKITKELPYFNIKVRLPKFRYSKGTYYPDRKTNSIYKGIASIKYCNTEIAEQMYLLRDKHYDTFVDLLVDLTENTSINSRQLNILIILNFFSEFGSNGKLAKIFNEFNKGKNKYGKKYIEKTKMKRIEILKDYENSIPDEKVGLKTQIDIEKENLGYVQVHFSELPKSYLYVLDGKFSKYSPRIEAYCLATGVTKTLKLYKKQFDKNPFDKGSIINVSKYQQRRKAICVGKDDNGKPKFEQSEEKEWWISKYSIIKNIDDFIK